MTTGLQHDNTDTRETKAGVTATEFLEQLFAPSERIYFRAIDPTRERGTKEFAYATEDIRDAGGAAWGSLRELNRQGYNIYFCVNFASPNAPRGEKGFIADVSITSLNAVFAEIDTQSIVEGDTWREEPVPVEEQIRRFNSLPVLPSALVFSGGKSIQAYYFLERADGVRTENLSFEDRTAWVRAGSQLTNAVSGDWQARNLSRVMRLPSFEYVSKGSGERTGRHAEVLIDYWHPERRYKLQELADKLPPFHFATERIVRPVEAVDSDIIPRPEDALSKFPRPRIYVPDGQTALKEGQRHKGLRAMLHTYRAHYGAGYEEMLAAAREDNDARCSPPKDEDEIEKLVRDTDERISYDPDEDYWMDKLEKLGILPDEEGGGEVKPKCAVKKDELVKLTDGVELFCEPDGSAEKGYVTVPVDGHFETYSVQSSEFRLWLTNEFYKAHGEAVSHTPLQHALSTLVARAYYEGKRHQVFTRVAGLDGKIYYDLGNYAWQVVEIDSEGWRVLDKSPVKFVRTANYKTQVMPVSGGSIHELRRFINVASEDDWTLFVGWLISVFRPKEPYALLSLAGTQDAAKSTTTKMIRLLVDPSKALVRAQPKEERDLMVGAKNNWLLAFDNLSHIPDWFSDALCRVSTGGGQANRQNYKDGDEYVFDVARPVVMNGIEELATRPDLADRTINIFLPSLKDEERKDEEALYSEYNEALPRILGGVFDVLSSAVGRLPFTHAGDLPRMADVTRFVTAAESKLGWESGAFVKSYKDYRRTARLNTLEASNVGMAILGMMVKRGIWEGTAFELLNEIGGALPSGVKPKNFPTNSRSMSSNLRRLVQSLAEAGIKVELPEGVRRTDSGKVGRIITITNTLWRQAA